MRDDATPAARFKNLFGQEEQSRCIFYGCRSPEGKLRVKGIAVEVKPNRPAARFRSAGIGSTKLDGVNLPGRFRVEPNVPFATSTNQGSLAHIRTRAGKS